MSRPYARQHGSASVPVGGVLRRCESRLAPDKSKYNHGSLLTCRRYLKRRILRRADSAKLHFLRPGMTGLCVSPDLKRNKPRGSSAYAKPPGARMNRKGNAGMFPRSFQMTLRNAWLKPCRAPVSSVNPCNLPWGLFTKDQLRQPARRVLLHPEIPWKNITLPPFPDGGLSRDGTTPVGAAVDFTFL